MCLAWKSAKRNKILAQCCILCLTVFGALCQYLFMTNAYSNHLAKAKTEILHALHIAENPATKTELQRAIATLEHLQGGSYLEALRRLEACEQMNHLLRARAKTREQIEAELWDGNSRD